MKIHEWVGFFFILAALTQAIYLITLLNSTQWLLITSQLVK